MHEINKYICQYEIEIYLQNVMHHAQSMNHDAAFQNLFLCRHKVHLVTIYIFCVSHFSY